MVKVTHKNNKQRPRFLNLLQIRLPITAVASIIHRVTGVVIFLVLPVIVYGLGLSLQSSEGFDQVITLLSSPACKFLLSVISISVLYHLLAGIRLLLLDLDIGYSLPAARWSARIVVVTSIIIPLLFVSGVLN